MKTYPLTRCPSCGESSTVKVELDRECSLVRCSTCGMVYASEYGDPDAIYVDGYLTGETEFGLNLLHPIFQEFLRFCADRRVHAIERATAMTGSWLDVGCGTGEVLAGAERRGWTAAGVEPVKESADIATERGLRVENALLQESGLPEKSFDVVSAFHVLEHMTDGVEFLRVLGRWATPGGYVAIEVPNWRSFHRLNNGASWPHLRPLEHVSHYAPKTLAATMRRAGLQPVTVRTTTYLWPDGQNLQHALDDLARQTWRRWMRGPLAHMEEHHGEACVVPTRAGWALLRGASRVYDVGRAGQVIVAVARVS